MMFGKNRISFNIIMDIVMLITMVLVSISGFILKVVIPSRHAVRFQDATPWCAHLLGLGRDCIGFFGYYSCFATHKHGIGFL